MDNALQTTQTFDLSPRSIEEAIKFAELLCKSNMIPKEFQGNTGNILVAVQWGMELGLKPLQAMQSIAVINGRPALWGDAVIALVRSNPLCEYVYESVENGTATCRAKRRGDPNEHVRSFSEVDAKQAGLLGKPGPWTQYRSRMLQLRARAFLLRDLFPDVLRGMAMAEELQDIEQGVMPAPASSLMPRAISQTQTPAIEHQESAAVPMPLRKSEPQREPAPRAEPQERPAQAEQSATQQNDVQRISRGMLNSLRAAMDRAGIDDAEICEAFKVDSLENLAFSDLNQALALCKQAKQS